MKVKNLTKYNDMKNWNFKKNKANSIGFLLRS